MTQQQSPQLPVSLSVAQLVTEEWMMKKRRSNHTNNTASLSLSSQPTVNVALPSFLEIMIMNETEQYIYTTIVHWMETNIRSYTTTTTTAATFLQSRCRSILYQLLRHVQQQQHVQNDNDNTESIRTTTATSNRLYISLRKIARYIQRYTLSLFIRILTNIIPDDFDTTTGTTSTTNSRHHHHRIDPFWLYTFVSRYALEITFVLRYIVERYIIIQYHGTIVESILYGMIRQKMTIAPSLTMTAIPIQEQQLLQQNNNTVVKDDNTQLQQPMAVLQPLTRNDQIRTAFIHTILGYVQEKIMRLYNNKNSNINKINNNSSSSIARNNQYHHNNNNYQKNSDVNNLILVILYPLWIVLYKGWNIYHQYQYYIGKSHYINGMNRLLRQVLVYQQQSQQSSTNLPPPPSSSTTIVSSRTTATSIMIRTVSIVTLVCYVTQMIHWYRERYRTIRQQELQQRRQQQEEEEEERMNHTTTSTANFTPSSNHDNVSGSNDTTNNNNNNNMILQLPVVASDLEILPVPLLPTTNGCKNTNSIIQMTMMKAMKKKGYCPICDQSIYHHRTSSSSSSSLSTTRMNHTNVTKTTITMLYGYVYCSYDCIDNYLRHNDWICPMTGHPVATTMTAIGNNNNNSKMVQAQPQQLIRLI